ncbi:hypothetical protein AA0488_2501 [Kozakia baliensis NRIC 0488]|nr:hypothetical protein AA0488_2501 [Kozakia baliensis NRIC 0488]
MAEQDDGHRSGGDDAEIGRYLKLLEKVGERQKMAIINAPDEQDQQDTSATDQK